MDNERSNKWRTIGDEHLMVDPYLLRQFNLDVTTLSFLSVSGMPSEFQELCFDYLKEETILTVNEKWDLDIPELDQYIAIGFNGSGDPVCINQINQKLLYLNHDDNFQEVFINTNLKTFALSVVRIQDFLDQMTPLTPASFSATEYADESYDALLKDIGKIDAPVFEARLSHWGMTLENIRWEREEAREEYNSQ